MTREGPIALLVIVLTTLAETPDGAPEGPMYAALMNVCGIDDFNSIVAVGVSSGWWTRANHVLTLKNPGREMASRVNAAIRGAA